MKIALSSTGNTLEDKLDMRFGRALGFIIYNLDDDTFKYIDNIQNMNASKGAGIQSAQNVVNENIEAIITGYCGPKAYNVLNCANVKIFNSEQMSIKEVIEKFKANELNEQEED